MGRTALQHPATEVTASALVTFAWYALPDVVPSRRVRAAAKVGLALALPAIATLGYAQGRGTADDVEDSADDAPEAGALRRIRALMTTPPVLDGSVAEAHDASRPLRAAAMVGGGVLLTAGSVALTVAGERGLHRLGVRLGERGVPWPHTAIGVVMGLVAAGLTMATSRR